MTTMLATETIAHNRFRSALSITGVAIAVISVVVIASLGNGLLTTGEERFDQSTMHLWISGKSVEISSQYLGIKEAGIDGAHELADQLHSEEPISMASPILTEIVYAFTEGEGPKPLFGIGVMGRVGTEAHMVSVSEGSPLSGSTHYNAGRYDGNWTYEVLIDSRAIVALNATIGDYIFIGKTLSEAEDRRFKIVGITNSLAIFSSNPMIVFHLSELQDLTGNKYYDRVNLLVIRLHDPAAADCVKEDLENRYPYEVSTNREYLRKILRQNATILISATAIVALAVVMGMVLVITTMLLSLNERRREIGILKVLGFSKKSLFMEIGVEGLIICGIGGSLGCLVSFPIVCLLNALIYRAVGFDGLVAIKPEFVYMGFSLAIVMGLVATAVYVAGINRITPIDLLRGT